MDSEAPTGVDSTGVGVTGVTSSSAVAGVFDSSVAARTSHRELDGPRGGTEGSIRTTGVCSLHLDESGEGGR